MSASVRIEDEAFCDGRYDVLAAVGGLANADHARGLMARVWRQCTLGQTYVLSVEMVRVLMGDRGPDALLSSGLGEATSDGIRIRGTRGRIEWLGKLRKASRKGGNATRAKWLASRPSKGKAKRPSDGPVFRGHPPGPPTPAPSPALISDQNPPIPPFRNLTLEPLDQSVKPCDGSNQAKPQTAIGRSPSAPSSRLTPRHTRALKGKSEFTEDETRTALRVLSYFTRKTGIEYEGAKAHIKLIRDRIRDGLTEHDLRCVVGYAWSATGLGWRDAVRADGVPMRRYLTPETLFGPEKVHKYLSPARAWYREYVEPSLSPEEKSGEMPINGHAVKPEVH